MNHGYCNQYKKEDKNLLNFELNGNVGEAYNFWLSFYISNYVISLGNYHNKEWILTEGNLIFCGFEHRRILGKKYKVIMLILLIQLKVYKNKDYGRVSLTNHLRW